MNDSVSKMQMSMAKKGMTTTNTWHREEETQNNNSQTIKKTK